MDKNNIQVYRDEIRALEEEIKMLREEYECSQHSSVDYSDGKIRMARKSSKGSPQEDLELCESFPDLKAQLDLFESDLSFMTKLTGICFTYYSRKPVEKSGTKTAHNYRLSGNCQSVPFQVEFQILEDNQSDKSILAIVTDLNIIIESEEHADLSKFVSRVEESGNLLLFFKSLSCFSEWCEHRKRTLSHFKSKYPDVVVLPEGESGDYMTLRNIQLPGFELMIVWKIHVNEEGKVIPALDLLHKIPVSSMLTHVEKANKFTSNAPSWFRSMLHVLGIEASIETLIKSLCKGK